VDSVSFAGFTHGLIDDLSQSAAEQDLPTPSHPLPSSSCSCTCHGRPSAQADVHQELADQVAILSNIIAQLIASLGPAQPATPTPVAVNIPAAPRWYWVTRGRRVGVFQGWYVVRCMDVFGYG
jgi:hypothetical protein